MINIKGWSLSGMWKSQEYPEPPWHSLTLTVTAAFTQSLSISSLDFAVVYCAPQPHSCQVSHPFLPPRVLSLTCTTDHVSLLLNCLMAVHIKFRLLAMKIQSLCQLLSPHLLSYLSSNPVGSPLFLGSICFLMILLFPVFGYTHPSEQSPIA